MSQVARGALGGWQTRTTFVLAMSAAALGLGNLWRFSYLSGEHGGAPFVISYVLCLFFIAVPVMVAEVVIGSHGKGSPVGSIRWAADRSLLSRGWMLPGVLACITGVLILSYYAVVAGWSLAYARDMQSGLFAAASAELVGQQFDAFLAEPARQVYWQTLFVLAVVLAVACGVKRGVGLLAWLAVPALIALLLALVSFGFDNGDMPAARKFLFSVKWVDFTPLSVLVALGHALFTLGVGVGVGISFGAYAPARIPIGRSVMAVAVFDTMIALLAGLAVFPVVFANNMEPAAGPGLLFISIPYAFGNILQGDLFGALFFVLVALAALGSAVAMMEAVVAALVQQLGVNRIAASFVTGFVIWAFGIAVIYSMAPERGPQWLQDSNLLVTLDGLTAGLLLPLVALLTALFVGWFLRPEILRLQLYRESGLFFSQWRFLLRYIAPPAIALILLAPLFVGRG